MLTALTILAEVLMGACAVLGWLFVCLYSRVRWYATPEGRHLMKFTVGLALTFSLSLLFQFADPGMLTRVVLSIALFGWLAFELGNRSRLHLLAKREARQEAAATARDDARDARRDPARDKARDRARDDARGGE